MLQFSSRQKLRKMKTNLKLQTITVKEMLNRSESGYNPQIWKERINSMTKYAKLQFYVIEADEKVWKYARFFASYVADGIYFFSDWSAYSSGISNNGFCKVFIDVDNVVNKIMFNVDSNGEGLYAKNCKENRQIFRTKLAPYGVMVSNSL